MKNLLCFIALFGLNQTSFADLITSPPSACPTADQCATPAMKTSLKIEYGRGMIFEYKGQIDTVVGLDSFKVNIMGDYAHGCTSFKDLLVYRDKSLIRSWIGFFSSPVFNLMGLPGHYRICCNWQSPSFNYMPYSWEFDLILKNWVSVASYEENKLLFSIYPNPAKELLYIESREEFLKEIALFNLSGEKIVELKVEALKTTVPLQDIAPGIYFLMVSTRSEKTSIKKFVRL